MKFLKLLAIGLVFLTVSACGSEIDRDATKMAESAIELQQLHQRMGDRSNLHGKPVSRQEYHEYEQKHIELFDQMSEKYRSSPEQWKEFKELVNQKIKDAEWQIRGFSLMIYLIYWRELPLQNGECFPLFPSQEQ